MSILGILSNCYHSYLLLSLPLSLPLYLSTESSVNSGLYSLPCPPLTSPRRLLATNLFSGLMTFSTTLSSPISPTKRSPTKNLFKTSFIPSFHKISRPHASHASPLLRILWKRLIPHIILLSATLVYGTPHTAHNVTIPSLMVNASVRIT